SAQPLLGVALEGHGPDLTVRPRVQGLETFGEHARGGLLGLESALFTLRAVGSAIHDAVRNGPVLPRDLVDRSALAHHLAAFCGFVARYCCSAVMMRLRRSVPSSRARTFTRFQRGSSRSTVVFFMVVVMPASRRGWGRCCGVRRGGVAMGGPP